jgi:Zn-dependent protease
LHPKDFPLPGASSARTIASDESPSGGRTVFGGVTEPTPFDLRWRMFGIDVRVHPFHWLMAAFICWGYLEYGLLSLVAAMFCIFCSVLIHELGHVVAFRQFGCNARILLWSFGGLAIPDRSPRKRWQRIVVYSAGVIAQSVLLGIAYLLSPEIETRILGGNPQLVNAVIAALDILIRVNFFWIILNLLPIWPLDGGLIAREVCNGLAPRTGVLISLQISTGVSGLLAAHAFLFLATGRTLNNLLPENFRHLPEGMFGGIFFAYFAVMSFQYYMAERDQGRYFDDPWN